MTFHPPPTTATAAPRADAAPLDRAVLQQALAHHSAVAGGLLPLLHEVQDQLGYVPDAWVPDIARGFNLSRAEVHGVLTYYHHFRRVPPGRHVVQICRAEACQACGAEALVQVAQSTVGCDLNNTSASGGVTLEAVYCLGLCASSPAVMVDGQPRARMTAPALQALLQRLEAA